MLFSLIPGQLSAKERTWIHLLGHLGPDVWAGCSNGELTGAGVLSCGAREKFGEYFGRKRRLIVGACIHTRSVSVGNSTKSALLKLLTEQGYTNLHDETQKYMDGQKG